MLRASSAHIIGDVRESVRSICQAKVYESCTSTEYGIWSRAGLAILGLAALDLARYLTSGQRFMFNSPEYASRGWNRVSEQQLHFRLLSTFPQDAPFLTPA